jgi:transcriptional regulator with XRE-family HTH domain
MSAFSEWLNQQLEKERVGINQLALNTGLSSSGVSKLRLGQRQPEAQTVLKLAEYFKVDSDWLLALAGHRRVGHSLAQELATLEDPQLRVWMTAKNLNRLSPASRRAIICIIKTELELKANPDKPE